MSKTYAIDWDLKECKFDVPTVQLWYPRLDGNAKEIEIELSDVRAADSLRISYDFERDGWVVKQASIFSWPADDEVCDADWQEVAFIKARGRERTDEMEEAMQDGRGE